MKKRHTVVLAVTIVTAALVPAGGADWPAYRHDSTRGGYTAESLKPPLGRQWAHVPPAPPRPAWPEPRRELHPMPFDYAPQVVVAGGVAYYGSSADHTVRALDLATGRRRWSFRTGAPVRFAPVVQGGRLFVGSDDGWVYCLSAAGGKPLWRFRGGPTDEMILGNEAMISRWPLRSGLVVEGDTVYFTAGMWPFEGVFACALGAADGKVLWKTQPTGGFAPQGYLAANDKVLVAPAGRANAWVIDRPSGKAGRGNGHCWAMVKSDRVFSGPPPDRGNENLPIKGGVDFAARSRSIIVWDASAPKKARRVRGGRCAAVSDDTFYAAGGTKITAYTLDRLGKKWEIEAGRVFSIIVAGRTVVAGGDGAVTLLDAASGRKVWSAKVDGQARGLAVADGRLIVSTHTGRIVCFGANKPGVGADPAIGRPPRAGRSALAEQIIKDTGVTAGFCLIQGVGDGGLALDLAKRSDLRIFCAESDGEKVAAARERLAAAGLYGTRVTVHHVASATLPYPDYFADLVVAAAPSTEHYRVLRPCGGKAYFPLADKSAAAKIRTRLASAGAAAEEVRVTPAAVQVVRGALPGAGWWTHQYADAGKSGSSGDKLVRWPLKLLWFGKPGPGRMMNRHWRGSAPVCVDGRMFIVGQHSVIAVDAYNGRELWSRQMPSINRRVVDIRGGGLAADADGIYLATGDMCLRLDAATGKTLRAYRLPLARPRIALTGPRTFTLGDAGTVTIRNTAAAVELNLTTKVTRGDSWDLFFDFRPPDRRTGLYGDGAFQAIVVPASVGSPTASWRSGLWSACPEIEVAAASVDAGTRTTVRIPWDRITKLVGRKPADFTFGAILNSSDDGRKLTRRTYKFANAASYRMANCWGLLTLAAEAPAAPPARVAPLSCEHPELLTWGNLVVAGEVILGTMVVRTDSPSALVWGRDFSSQGHDYTGPAVAKVLGDLGLQPGARHVFALDTATGRPRWIYTAKTAVGHNALAVGGGRVYLIDGRTPAEIVVLDLATGRPVARFGKGLAHVALRLGGGVLLATDLKGMTAYDVTDGRPLWSVKTRQAMHHCSAYVRAPVIAGGWVCDEPYAYDLRTGKPRTRPAAAGQEPQPWRWGGFRGCGTVSGAENMLFYRGRQGLPGLLDLAGATGSHDFQAIRPGCYINIIPAGGLVLMPEASSGCGCPFNFQTTVALVPATGPAETAAGKGGRK